MKRLLVTLLVLLASCGQIASPIDAYGGSAGRYGLGGPIAPQGGTITSVQPASGGGLMGGGTAGAVTLGLSSAGCSAGYVPTWNGTAWTCAAGSPAGTITGTLTNGDLVIATGAHSTGPYGGSTPTPCTTGNVVTGVSIAATGVASQTCTPIGTDGGVTGTGTANFMTQWTGASAIGNSLMATDGNGDLEYGSGALALWSSTSLATGTADTGIARNAAGVLEVDNGTAGTLRDILVRAGVFAGGVTNGSASLLRQQGDTWLDMATGAAVTLPAGVTSNWNPFGAGSAQTFVDVIPNPMSTGNITSAATSVVDGIVSDGTGSAPISGALRVICQAATNHGIVVFTTSEGSTSSSGNQLYINADNNASDTAFGLAHRQCALQVYNPDRNKWQFVAASDGTLHRLSFSGTWKDTSQGATVNNYNAGGFQGGDLCSLTRMLVASSSTTTLTGLTSCNDGDVKIIQFLSTGYTIANNSSSSSAGNRFWLPGNANITPGTQSTYVFIYNAGNAGQAGWYLLAVADQSAGGISGLTTNIMPIATSATSIGNGPLSYSGSTVSSGSNSVASQMFESPGRSLPSTLTSSSNNNNLTVDHTYEYIGLQTSSSASATLTGMSAGVDGEEKWLCNYGPGSVVITSGDSNSSSGNQFWMNGFDPWTLYGTSGGAHGCVLLRYEGQNNKWVGASQNDSPVFRGNVQSGGWIASPSTPSANHGSLSTGATGAWGQITSIGANTSVTLTWASAYANDSLCTTQPNSTSVALEDIVVTAHSASAVTFSCFSVATSVAANCDDFTYQCAGR